MIKRTATAHWQGSIKESKGTLSTQSQILNQTPYSFLSRFGDAPNTNPEELLAAAHAGCFSMMLSNLLTQENFTVESIETRAEVILDDGAITSSHLTLKAKVPGITKEKFREIANAAEQNCPVSKLFKADIQMTFELNA